MENTSANENKWIDLSQHADMPKDLTDSTQSTDSFTNKTSVAAPVATSVEPTKDPTSETSTQTVETTPVEITPVETTPVEQTDTSVVTPPETPEPPEESNEIVTNLPSDDTQTDDETNEEDVESDVDEEDPDYVPNNDELEEESSEEDGPEDLPLDSMVVVVYDREYQDAEPSSKYMFTGRVHSKDLSKSWVKIDFGEDEGTHNFRKRFSFDFSRNTYVDQEGWVVRIHSVEFDYDNLRIVDNTANTNDEEKRIVPQAVQVPAVALIGYLLFIALVTPMMRAVCH